MPTLLASSRNSCMRGLISRIPHGLLRFSVLQGREEKKGQYDNGYGPSCAPRKAQGFIIPEIHKGEFVMLEFIPIFEFLINGIGHRNPVIADY